MCQTSSSSAPLLAALGPKRWKQTAWSASLACRWSTLNTTTITPTLDQCEAWSQAGPSSHAPHPNRQRRHQGGRSATWLDKLSPGHFQCVIQASDSFPYGLWTTQLQILQGHWTDWGRAIVVLRATVFLPSKKKKRWLPPPNLCWEELDLHFYLNIIIDVVKVDFKVDFFFFFFMMEFLI